MWVQTRGRCPFAKLEGTTNIAIGDQLQMVNTQVYAVQDGGAAMTTDSIGVAEVAYDTNAVSSADKAIYLHGREVIIG